VQQTATYIHFRSKPFIQGLSSSRRTCHTANVFEVYIVLSFGFKITRLPSLTLKDGNLKKLLSSRKTSWFFKYVRIMLAKCHVSMATTLSPVSLILHFRPLEPKIVNFADPWWSNFCYLYYLFITQQAAIINITNPRHNRPIATASRVMIVSLSFSEIRNTKQKKSLHIACIIDNSINYTPFYKDVQTALHTLPH